MSTRDAAAPRLAIASVVGSLGMAAALGATFLWFDSQLALAQAADSLADCLAGGVLLWAMHQSALPADAEHPHGHGHAEPIGALVVAILVGTLAVEVFRNAVSAILVGSTPELDPILAAVFTAKILFKGALVGLAGAALRARANPALDALRVDARNDVLVGSLAVIGFVVARAGLPAIDAGLAIVVALYVANSALRLARDNIALLMGSAAPADRTAALVALAAATPGVVRIERAIVTWHGASFHVYIEIAVDETLTVHAGHDVGHAVEAALAAEVDVSRAIVHVGPA